MCSTHITYLGTAALHRHTERSLPTQSWSHLVDPQFKWIYWVSTSWVKHSSPSAPSLPGFRLQHLAPCSQRLHSKAQSGHSWPCRPPTGLAHHQKLQWSLPTTQVGLIAHTVRFPGIRRGDFKRCSRGRCLNVWERLRTIDLQGFKHLQRFVTEGLQDGPAP